jgi:hypothetical protein
MAGLNCSVNFDDVTLAVGSYKTVASVQAPANHMVRVKSLWVCANGVAGDAEHLYVRFCRVTGATGTGTAITPQKLNNALTATPLSTARVNFTVEPTADGTLPYIFPHKIHPQGASAKEASFDECFIKEATELSLQVQVPSGGTAVKCSGHLIIEE